MKLAIKWLFVFTMAGCLQQPVRVNEQRPLTDQINVTTDEELESALDAIIIYSRYTIEQKSELDSLRVELNQKLTVNTVISLKLRTQLFKVLLAPEYNPIEVQIIREMLERNSVERNSLIHQSIEIVNVITGRTDISAAAEKLRREVFILY